jgi:hypothetical protein
MDKGPEQVYQPRSEDDPLDLFAAEEGSGDTLLAFESPVDARASARSNGEEVFTADLRERFADVAPHGDTAVAHARTASGSSVSAAWSTPRTVPAAVAVEQRHSLGAWVQRNGLSVAAVVVACLGTAAILIGMQHRADTELDSWARLDVQPPAPSNAAPSTGASSGVGAPNGEASAADTTNAPAAPPEIVQDGLGQAADERATPTATGLDASRAVPETPAAVAAREAAAREAAAREIAERERAARDAIARNAATRDAAARDAAPPAATTQPPASPVSRPTDTTASNTVPSAPLAGPNPTSSNTATASNAAATVPPAVQPQPSQPAPPPATPPAPAPSETTLAASPNPSIVASVAREPIEPPALPTIRERQAQIQSIVNRYRDAYNSMDANAAKAVWPSVNAKQLGDSFARLEKLEYQFQPCTIFFDTGKARATCEGRVRSVAKSDKREVSVPARWEFTLKEVNREWAIDSVVAK